MSSSPAPLPAAREPRYTGPATGEFDASLEALARMRDSRLALAVTQPFPVCTAPLEPGPAAFAAFGTAVERVTR
jgi:hypothetical protein